MNFQFKEKILLETYLHEDDESIINWCQDNADFISQYEGVDTFIFYLPEIQQLNDFFKMQSPPDIISDIFKQSILSVADKDKPAMLIINL